VVGSFQRPSQCDDRRRGVWETTGGSEDRPPNSDVRRRGVVGESRSPRGPPKKTMTDGVVVRPTVNGVEPPRQQCLCQGQITPTRVPSALDCVGSASPPPAQTVGAGGSDGPSRKHGCHAAAVRQRDTQVWTSTRGRSVVRAGYCSRRYEPRQQVGGQRLAVAGGRQEEAGGRQGQTSGCGRRPTAEGWWWLQADCSGS